LKSNIEWKYWGATDPLYGVSSVPGRGRRGSNPWTDTEFYSRSESEWRQFHKQWEHYGIKTDACVEIGCGAGRMTGYLAKVFRVVHACDVSAGMISYARRHCDPGVVQFHVSNGRSLPLASESVTAAFSTIVFQHFDIPEDGLLYFRELSRVMLPGATFMLNVPLYHFPNGPAAGILVPAAYWVVRRLAGARATCKRTVLWLGTKFPRTRLTARIIARFGGYMHSTRYSFPWLYGSLINLGFQDVEVWTTYVPTEERCHDFVFARKR
jgi:ubiquinone/menaquinone biosynthesis C-methylase UbiE